MRTLDGPIWSRCSIALTCPARSHFQRTMGRDRRARVGMNDTAHQEKKKNEETKTGKRSAGEEKRRATDFKEAVCCPSTGRSGGSTEKK